MKDLLLLPFYLTAFFSNSLEQLTSTEVNDSVNEQERFEIRIDLNQFFNLETLKKDEIERKAFDKELFKLELLQNSRKK